jgi:hypothetical protein
MAPRNRRAATERGSAAAAAAPMVGASEEVLVSIPGAMVHLIDDQECPFLSAGEFSVVRVQQQGNGMVAFVRVGEQLRWPLTKDEPAVKLDTTHYFFTIRVPRPVDKMDRETARQVSSDNITYILYGMSVWVLVLALARASTYKMAVSYGLSVHLAVSHGGSQAPLGGEPEPAHG